MEILNTSITGQPEVPNANDLPGLITLETRMLINDVFSCGFQPVITMVGLMGNILSMSVLIYLGFREVTNILLVGLTLMDLLYLIMWYGPMTECIVRRFDEVSAINLGVEYKASSIMVASKLGTASRLYTCLIAVERYIAVLHPLKAPTLLTRKKILIACIVLTVLPFALGFQAYLLFDVQETFSAKYNATVKYITFTKFTVENLDFVVLYNDLIMAIPFHYTPIVVVMYCTAAILIALLRSRQNRLHMTAGRQDEKKAAEQRQVTKVLISICIVYVLCTLPSIAVQVARLLFQKEGYSDVGRYRNLSFTTITISQLFSLVNSSINFIFYIAYSRKFTAAAKNLCLWWRRAAKSRSAATGVSSAVTLSTQAFDTAVSG